MCNSLVLWKPGSRNYLVFKVPLVVLLFVWKKICADLNLWAADLKFSHNVDGYVIFILEWLQIESSAKILSFYRSSRPTKQKNSEFKQTLVLSKRKNLHTLWLQMTYIKMFHTVVCLCLLLYDTLLKKSINLVPVSHSKCNCCAGATCEYIANRLVVLLGPDSRLTPNSTIELRTGNGIVEQHSG